MSTSLLLSSSVAISRRLTTTRAEPVSTLCATIFGLCGPGSLLSLRPPPPPYPGGGWSKGPWLLPLRWAVVRVSPLIHVKQNLRFNLKAETLTPLEMFNGKLAMPLVPGWTSGTLGSEPLTHRGRNRSPIPTAFRGPRPPTTGAPRRAPPRGGPYGQGIGRGDDAPSRPSFAVATGTSVNGGE